MQKKSNYNGGYILITGGHLTPALAVIDKLKEKGLKKILWVGRFRTMKSDKSNSAEYRVIRDEMNIPFENLETGKIVRFSNVSTFVDFIVNIFKIPLGFINSLRILIKWRPIAIVSFGGYLALPIVFAGKLLGIPSITHEQTVVVGLANKMISKISSKVLISWKNSKIFFPKAKVVYTGNPIRREVFEIKTNKYRINSNLRTIYITGGNQGAHKINIVVLEIIDKLLNNFNVIHQTGLTTVTNDYEKCVEKMRRLDGIRPGRYIVKGNIYGNEIGEVFSKSSIIVSRSGANTLSEILALGKLSVLIPIPWSIGNEQFLNARILKDAGLGIIIEEKILNPKTLYRAILGIDRKIDEGKSLNNKSLKKSRAKGKQLVKRDAADLIVREIEKLIFI